MRAITQLAFLAFTSEALRCHNSGQCMEKGVCNFQYKVAGHCEGCLNIDDCKDGKFFSNKHGLQACCLKCTNANQNCKKRDKPGIDHPDSYLPGGKNDPALDKSPCDARLLVKRCEDFNLAVQTKTILNSVGFTQCMRPFGSILVAAHFGMTEERIQMVGKILAEILDKDQDGRIDDLKLRKHLKNYRQNYWIAMPVREWLWNNVHSEKLFRWRANGDIGTAVTIPNWHMDAVPEDLDIPVLLNNRHPWVSVILEKVYNYLTLNWALRFPEQFGLGPTDMTNLKMSVLAKEVTAAECKIWKHPLNSCPRSVDDGCNDFECNAVAFHHQAALIAAGMEPAWYSSLIPTRRKKLMKKLSPAYKRLLKKPRYSQVQKPLNFSYPICDRKLFNN